MVVSRRLCSDTIIGLDKDQTMRRFSTLFLALAIMAGALPIAVLSAQAGEAELAYAIFIRVNGRPITQDNVVQAMRYLLKREFNGVPPQDELQMEALQKAAVRDLVRAYLIHHEASRLNVKLNREFSKRAIALSGLRPDEITPTIRRIIEADDLFEEIMMGEGTPIRQSSPREVRDFYLNNQDDFRTDAFIIVRGIFIGEDGRRPQSFFREQAEDIIRQIEAVPLYERTNAFDKLAKEKSQDVFAQFGGRLTGNSPDPWMPQEFRNQTPEGDALFPAEMEQGIKRLTQKGEVRLAVSEDGMHILYLEDIRGGSIMPWAEAKRVIEFHFRQRRTNEAMRTWINRIYDHSDVTWHDGSRYEKAQLLEPLLPSERGGRR